MGEVCRARDTQLHPDVAVKVLPEAFAADADRLARFEREAQTLASLSHPNIAHIYGIERSGTTRLTHTRAQTWVREVRDGRRRSTTRRLAKR